MDDDTEVIELLDDQFADALLGAVYDDEGTPVPCYSSAMVMMNVPAPLIYPIWVESKTDSGLQNSTA